jgi:flagellar biosynthesis protein FlhG
VGNKIMTAEINAKNIVVVASGKGGVGKTWFSISLALTLRKSLEKVLIFDGDLGLANVDIQLNLTPKRDLVNFLHEECSFKEAITSYESGGIDVLTGRSGSDVLASIPADKRKIIKDNLIEVAKSYDIVIIDLGAGIDGIVKDLCQVGENCFIITTDEPTSMTDAYALIKVLSKKSPHIKIHIVVNRADSEKEGIKTFQTLCKVCESFLKFTPKLGGIVRYDKKVRDAIRHQEPIITYAPRANSTKDISDVAYNVTQAISEDLFS